MTKLQLLALIMFYAGYRMQNTVITDEIDSEYDFIIVGGGTTGSALAGRLSEDPNVKILLLEAGESDLTSPSLCVLSQDPLQLTDADWDYRTVPQKDGVQALQGKVDRLPRGKILGGTSSMNKGIYSRGSPHDYDSWEDHVAKGWSWEDVEKYFKKAENAADDTLSDKLGRNGPLTLERNYNRPILKDIVYKAAAEAGIPETDYIDGIEGFSEIVVTRAKGMRVSSVDAYIRKHFPERKNRLHIVVGAHVTKILFSDETSTPRATGVKFIKDGEVRTAFAKKEVIISAGVYETPHLLMLSGIGPKEHLEDMGIDVIADLPGVGSNLQDHIRIMIYLYSDKMPEDSRITDKEMKEGQKEFIANGTGPLLSNFISSVAHFRTKLAGTPASLSTIERPFPEIQLAVFPVEALLSEIRNFYIAEMVTRITADYIPDIQDAAINRNGVITSFGIIGGLEHPKSTGTVRLNSSDLFAYPLIDPKYFTNQDDIKVFTEGLRIVEKMLTSETFRELNIRQVLQPYCHTSELDNFPRSDEFYECWIRHSAVTEYHPCCTARIGSSEDKNAVVDERLRVYGVTGLRVADASVMPHKTSSNLQAPCYMIAEKASDMIKEDWEILRT